jgi:Ni/Fe-hydrogenase subunit HybB-like protein
MSVDLVMEAPPRLLHKAPAPKLHHAEPAPVNMPLLTPGVWVLLALSGIGFCFYIARFIFGLGAITNLTDWRPWGIWVSMDVESGVALAAGGFTTAALAHVFHRAHYHSLVRPALLAAMLGYTFVGIGLLTDLGRWYNIWHPAMPWMWSPNSVLFEVAMCVMCYLTVLYTEFAPVVCERLLGEERWPRLRRIALFAHPVLNKMMPFFIIAGVVLSCLHQSSLGNLPMIAPTKFHPLWWTPILGLLFLLSAFAAGFAVVVFQTLYAAWSFKKKPDMGVLAPLSKYLAFFLGFYAAFKVGDMVIRESYRHVSADWTTACFLIEMLGCVLLPFVMLLSEKVRRSPLLLFITSLLIVLGIVFNRVNVFVIGYRSVHYPDHIYIPSIGEIAVTVGLFSFLIFLFRVIVTYFPVLAYEPESSKT